MSWNDVDEKRGGASGRFVSFEDGKGVRLRILDEEPKTIRVHKISQPVKRGDKTEEVFRTIPATPNPDDNYILQMNGKRYPDVPVYNMRCFEYKRDDAGKFTDPPTGEIKVLQGGPAIFKDLKKIYEEFGHLNQFDVVITRTGKGRDTEYAVSAAPNRLDCDVAGLTAKIAQDASLNWDNIFPPASADDQKKALTEAGFNVTYDPAAEIAARLSWDDASKVRFTFGKYGQKGQEKTVGELVIIDAGYVTWAAENVTSSDELAAACRVAVKHMSQLESGTAPVKQIEQPKAAPKPAPENKAKRADLEKRVSDAFENDERYSDMQVMIDTLKRHGEGKTRVKDLTLPQLESLVKEISNG